MTAARIPSAALQVVHRGTAGARLGVPTASLQVVHRGTDGARLLVSEAVLQLVSRSVASRARVSDAVALVVHNGDDGAMVRESFGALQVVYTTGSQSAGRQRAWTFDLDGHTFYVLDLDTNGALLFDLTTGQWTRFETAGHAGAWNFKNGFHWRDGHMVIGGKDAYGILQRLATDVFTDEGWRTVEYEVRGLLTVNGIDFYRQYALRMVGSAGRNTAEPAELRMQFSDDEGATWSKEFTVELVSDTRQRLEFRSLGAFTAPGRIFRLYSEGGVKYIGYVEAEIGGENERTPA